MALEAASVRALRAGTCLPDAHQRVAFARALVRISAVAIAYFALAWAGLQLHAAASSSITLFWAPAGLGFAAVMLWGPWMLVGVYVGATAINGATDAGWAAAPIIGLGNSAEALVIAIGLRRISPSAPAIDIRHVGDLAPQCLAALGGCVIAATVGTAALVGNGLLDSESWVEAWSVWWAGDLVGAVVIGPLVLLIATVGRSGLHIEPKDHHRAQESRRARAVLSLAKPLPGDRRAAPAGLTPREIEVLELIAEGLCNKEIAERLVISPHTVASHVEHIYAKIGVSNRVRARRFAAEHQLV